MLELMIIWFGAMGYSVEVLETEHYTECLPNEIIGGKFIDCHTEFINYDTKTVYFGSAEVTTDLWKYVGGKMGYIVELVEIDSDCLPNEITGAKDFECHTKFVNHDRKMVYFNSAETKTNDLPFYVEGSILDGGRLEGSPRPFPQPNRLGLNIFEHTMLKINCKECDWNSFESEPIIHHTYRNLENSTEMLDLMTVQYNKLGYKVILFPTDVMGCLPVDIGRVGCFKELVHYDRKIVYFDEKLVTTNLWEYDIDSWGFSVFEHATLHITAGSFHPFGYSYEVPLVINDKNTWINPEEFRLTDFNYG